MKTSHNRFDITLRYCLVYINDKGLNVLSPWQWVRGFYSWKPYELDLVDFRVGKDRKTLKSTQRLKGSVCRMEWHLVVKCACCSWIPLSSSSSSKHGREPVVTFRFHKKSKGLVCPVWATTRNNFSLSFYLCFDLHQLQRETSGSKDVKCYTDFTWMLTLGAGQVACVRVCGSWGLNSELTET